MSNDLNLCQFIGRLGQDPDTRYSANGNCFCNLSLAVGKQWKDKQGQKQEKTEWVRVTIIGKLGEAAAQYLSKGSRIYVAGELATRKWTDQNGQDRYTTEVMVGMNGKLQMLDEKPKTQAPQQSAPQQPQRTPQQQAVDAQRPAQANHAPEHVDDFDDSIPFMDHLGKYLWNIV